MSYFSGKRSLMGKNEELFVSPTNTQNLIKEIEKRGLKVGEKFNSTNHLTIHNGDCLEFLKTQGNEVFDLIVTSPPYNLGKEYEKKIDINKYFEQQKLVITECARTLKETGSICWQVGNYVKNSSIIPLDSLLYPIFAELDLIMRNRIIWHFEHGLHSSKRFSGRYETIIWFTKTDNYYFDIDPVRVPQKYPGKKYYKGPKAGQYSSNPLGKNPGDLWIIPNVKNNHVEKTDHPCQFPVELIERLVLSMSPERGIVFDPFMGVGSTLISALKNNRKAVGTELVTSYVQTAYQRVYKYLEGQLPLRPMNKPVYDPQKAGSISKNPFNIGA